MRAMRILLDQSQGTVTKTPPGWATRWAERVPTTARAIRCLVELRQPRTIGAIVRFHHLDRPHHALDAEEFSWLHRLSEVQATLALAHFVNQRPERVRALLQALAPDWVCPENAADLRAEAEVPAAGGFVDLLITGTAKGRVFGAVIEAKFGHHMWDNPLPAYKAAGVQRGLELAGRTLPDDTMLIVLGTRRGADIDARFSRQRSPWRFVSWGTFLRRFEGLLDEQCPDEDFRRFRRTLWKKAHER